MLWFEWIVGAFAFLLLPVTILLAIELFAALLHSATHTIDHNQRPRLAVLMPAHDEALTIASAIQSLLPELHDTDRLLVVADNCSDETAALAASAGAEVIERCDPAARGKGYALDFGVQHLAKHPPDIVVIVDADCRVSPNSLDVLARACTRTGRPMQAIYLIQAPDGAGPMVRIAEFACVLKNQLRPLGLHKMGLPCQLMGSGMALPWKLIRNARLATGHIVEDLKLGLELASRRAAPLLCPEALITSFFPNSPEGFAIQRTRWEHGYLATLLNDTPPVLWGAVRTRNLPLLALGLDLLIPPVALLAMLCVFTWAVSAILYGFGAASLPLLIATTELALLTASILLSWITYGRKILSLPLLALAAGYALRKVPIYAKFMVARQTDWIRSKRDGNRAA